MRQLIDRLIYWSFSGHCDRNDNADFEVCRDWRCRLGRWAECLVYPERRE